MNKRIVAVITVPGDTSEIFIDVKINSAYHQLLQIAASIFLYFIKCF